MSATTSPATASSRTQLKFLRERGIDLTIFSPRASGMGHHVGSVDVEPPWARHLQRPDPPRLRALPAKFHRRLPLAAVARRPRECIARTRTLRQRTGLCRRNLNPDPSGGHFDGPPLNDQCWYPFYEKMVELDVPAMVHVTGSCNPGVPHHWRVLHHRRHHGVHAVHSTAEVFKDFPTLKLIIPHGGGAVPFHWGRYRGIALDKARRARRLLKNNIFFDTCVYHQPGINSI